MDKFKKTQSEIKAAQWNKQNIKEISKEIGEVISDSRDDFAVAIHNLANVMTRIKFDDYFIVDQKKFSYMRKNDFETTFEKVLK